MDSQGEPGGADGQSYKKQSTDVGAEMAPVALLIAAVAENIAVEDDELTTEEQLSKQTHVLSSQR